MTNYHDSFTLRLPPEILTTAASYLGDDASLIAATQVCHFWRSTLISSPYLWSHLTSDWNMQRTLMFLERSKSAPISVHLTGSVGSWGVSLMGLRDRLTSLRATDTPSLDQLLIKPLPVLRNLDVVASGYLSYVRTLAATDPVPRLTKFYFKLNPRRPGDEATHRTGDNLLDFLRSCPLLEVVFFSYGDPDRDIEFTIDGGCTEPISLSFLRSFTHESPFENVHVGLFNRLLLPPTCHVTFAITDSIVLNRWVRGFPPLRDPSYLFDVKKVEVAFHYQKGRFTTVNATYLNSRNAKISLNRLANSPHPNNTVWVIDNFLDFFGSSTAVRSAEILHFKCCQVFPPPGYVPRGLTRPLRELGSLKTIVLSGGSPAFFLVNPPRPAVWCPRVENLVVSLDFPTPHPEPMERDVLERVCGIAMSRREHATPLKTVALFLPEAGPQSQTRRVLIELLRRRVESVEVKSLGEWMEWCRDG